MLNNKFLGHWIQRFLMEHIICERNLSKNTQSSYRDTLVLLLPFIAKQINKRIDKFSVEDISADLIRDFLQHLEHERKCSIATRNTRLAAIHALARFIAEHNPEYIDWCMKVRGVPFKKAFKTPVAYLDKTEMDLLLNMPNRDSNSGARDYLILLFLYNSGARAEELAKLRIKNLNLDTAPSVRLIGKGNKHRICPLWSLTTKLLTSMVAGRSEEDFVFLNCRKQPLTRFGIHSLVKRYSLKASKIMASLKQKCVSPHTLRHTTAMHLLRAGVDINTIRAWLGHVSLDTTNIYLSIDLEMKADALTHCEILDSTKNERPWKENKRLMNFLKSL